MKTNDELGLIDPIETPSQDSGTSPKPKGRGRKPKPAPALKAIKGVKLPPQPKATKGEPNADGEPSDRLPTTLKELKETKGGFVASLFLTGKDEATIVNELKEAFNLTDAQSAKITRRITGRAPTLPTHLRDHRGATVRVPFGRSPAPWQSRGAFLCPMLAIDPPLNRTQIGGDAVPTPMTG